MPFNHVHLENSIIPWLSTYGPVTCGRSTGLKQYLSLCSPRMQKGKGDVSKSVCTVGFSGSQGADSQPLQLRYPGPRSGVPSRPLTRRLAVLKPQRRDYAPLHAHHSLPDGSESSMRQPGSSTKGDAPISDKWLMQGLFLPWLPWLPAQLPSRPSGRHTAPHPSQQSSAAVLEPPWSTKAARQPCTHQRSCC